jgi:hypothetical protein
MRRLRFLAFALVALLAAVSVADAQTAQTRTYMATLSAAEEVPANASTATGQATFQLSADGQTLSYRLTVNNIQNPIAAHIHIGAKGENGPVVFPLFGPAPAGSGAKSGVLSEGTAGASNLSGTLAGQPLSALIAQMDAGRAYANVHTDNGVAPPNQGPGDLPGGEIRGQIVAQATPGVPSTGSGGGHPSSTAIWLLALAGAGLAFALGAARARRARSTR